MTAFPEYMDEGSILREYEDGQARIIAEFCETSSDTTSDEPTSDEPTSDDVNGGYRAAIQPAQPVEQRESPPAPAVSRRVSLLEAITVIRDAQRCPDCGKTRAVINFGRGIRPEKVSPATHCSCVGGPAYTGIGGTL